MRSTDSIFILRVTAWPDPQRRSEFESWWTKVHQSALTSTGTLGLGTDKPTGDELHDSVLLSVKFDSPEHRQAWRDWLVTASSDAPVQRPLAMADEVEGGEARVSKVITSTVPSDRRQEFFTAQRALNTAATEAPGFVSFDTYPPAFDGAEWVTVLTFDSPENLQLWDASPQRRKLVDRITSIANQEVHSVPSGFAQWFTVSRGTITETPTWKQAMVVVAVLYAMVSILDMTLGDAIGGGWSINGEFQVSGLGLPMPVTVFIGNAIGTILLTWLLMPWVTRGMRWFLDPGATPKTTAWGVVFLIGVYIVEIVTFGFINQALGV